MSIPPVSTPSPHRPAVLATQIQTSLADQTWSTRTIDSVPCFRVFLLRRGRAAFMTSEESPVEMTGPQILWLPFRAGGNVRVHAGGSGAWMLATEELVSRIVGDNPLSGNLHPALDRPLVAPTERIESVITELEALFSAVAREMADPRTRRAGDVRPVSWADRHAPVAGMRRDGWRRHRCGHADRSAISPTRRAALPRQSERGRLLPDAKRDARPPAQRLHESVRKTAATTGPRSARSRGPVAAAAECNADRTGRLQPRISGSCIFQPLFPPPDRHEPGRLPQIDPRLAPKRANVVRSMAVKAHINVAQLARSATSASSRSRPFIRAILKVRFGSRLCENGIVNLSERWAEERRFF